MAKATGLAREQRRALDRLSAREELRDFYLAGGSAIAIHLGHRRSLDLDFFSLRRDQPLDAALRAAKEAFDDLEVVAQSDVTLQLLADGARIDFVTYPYPPLDRPQPHGSGALIATLRDLGVMKLVAVAKRGLRRDFWDLHEILTRGDVALAALGRAYRKRYGVAEADLYPVLKALTYFGDAERDPAMPAGLSARHWNQIQQFFRSEAPRLLR